MMTGRVCFDACMNLGHSEGVKHLGLIVTRSDCAVRAKALVLCSCGQLRCVQHVYLSARSNFSRTCSVMMYQMCTLHERGDDVQTLVSQSLSNVFLHVHVVRWEHLVDRCMGRFQKWKTELS